MSHKFMNLCVLFLDKMCNLETRKSFLEHFLNKQTTPKVKHRWLNSVQCSLAAQRTVGNSSSTDTHFHQVYLIYLLSPNLPTTNLFIGNTFIKTYLEFLKFFFNQITDKGNCKRSLGWAYLFVWKLTSRLYTVQSKK